MVVFRTKPLSPAFLEILGHKYNWVMTLTFLGQVTSSVTWPFDSPYPISYWYSIVTKPLSLTVFEILASKVPVLCKSSLRNAHARYHVTCTPYAKFGYIFEFSTPKLPIHYDTFIGLRWRIRGVVRPPMLNAKSSKNFPRPNQNWANFDGFGGLGVSKSSACDGKSSDHQHSIHELQYTVEVLWAYSLD